VGSAILCLCAATLQAGLVLVNGCGRGGLGVIILDDGCRDTVGVGVCDNGGVANS
jgi:hypothetical protein